MEVLLKDEFDNNLTENLNHPLSSTQMIPRKTLKSMAKEMRDKNDSML